METKRMCPECNTRYEPTRSDQKFCTTTCRWKAWHKKKGNKKAKEDLGLAGINEPESKQEQLKTDLFASLRNVDVSTQTKPDQGQDISQQIPEPQKPAELKTQVPPQRIETKEYRQAKQNLDKITAYYQKALSVLEMCKERISETDQVLRKLEAMPDKNNPGRWSVDAQDLFGKELEDLAMNKEMERKKLEGDLQKYQHAQTKVHEEINKATFALRDAEQQLKRTKQYQDPKPKFSELLRGFMIKKQDEEQKREQETEIKEESTPVAHTQTEPNEQETTNVFQTPDTFEDEPETNNPKIVSSSQIRNMRFGSFPFKGKWKEFLGEPQLNFHLGIHGKPGGGKSTFCVQFADYLARNFGKVIYVSGEEGVTKTVQDKIIGNGINNPYLFFADIRTYEEIKAEISNAYHFIFIDSLDTLKIDAQKLRSLKEHYPQSSFITISQSTKDGKMRGSQEIMHDNDITVAVIRPGIAVTTKNRFGRTGLEFKVFDTLEANQKKTETKLSQSRGKPDDHII